MITYENSAKEGTEHRQTASSVIQTLIADLGSEDGMVRQYARNRLIRIGEPGVKPLINTLKNETGYARWEAAKALSLIGSPRAVQTLVNMLEDDDFSIRWLAAEGLIAAEQSSLQPLLATLVEKSDSIRLREGAHHVFNDFLHHRPLGLNVSKIIRPVLGALEDIEPSIEVPLAAKQALNALQNRPQTPIPVPKSHLNWMFH